MRQLFTCLVLTIFALISTGAYANSSSLFTRTPAGKAIKPGLSNRIQSLALPLEVKPTDRYLHHKLKDYLNGGRSTARMLARAERYFPTFEAALCEQGLPEDLKYLAVVESMLRPTVKSQVGAAGMWQLMPATARAYGLRVDYLIDERMDAEKASVAAARMLRDLHDAFGDWHLVIAAYNAGPGRVRADIRRSGGVTDYQRVRPYLPRETRNYVAGFVAAAYTLNHYADHGLAPAKIAVPTEVATVNIHQRISLYRIAKITGLTRKALRRLNPSVRYNTVPGNQAGIVLRLPLEYKDDLLTSLWGRTNLVQTTVLDDLLQAELNARAEGFDAGSWMLGCGNLANDYNASAKFQSQAGEWSGVWLERERSYAAVQSDEVIG